MSTVVQTSYAPQIQPGTPGMPSDEIPWSTETRQCETSAGIPFGVAVSQGTGDRGAVIGGTKFVGISERDITLNQVPLDPLSNVTPAADTFPQRANMPVRSRGRIWVIAQADVAADDPLYYESTGGTLSNSASGTGASGSVTFNSQPAANDTITLGGTAITFVATGATGEQVNIGPTLGDTLDALAAFINANAAADTNIAKFKAIAYPSSPGGAGEGSGANTLDLAAVTVGTAGNALTIAVGGTLASTTTITNMAGGTASATAVTGGKWVTSALAGQLAKVSLGIQQ